MNFLKCPRCGDRAYECLSTHDHCASCGYSTEFHRKPEFQIQKWALDLVGNPTKKISKVMSKAVESPEAAAIEVDNSTPPTAA